MPSLSTNQRSVILPFIDKTRKRTFAHANARDHSSKFSLDISISASTTSTRTFVLLVLTLLLVLCTPLLPRACANACAVDAPVTAMLMLVIMS